MVRQEMILEDGFEVAFGRHLQHEKDEGIWQAIRIPHDLIADAPVSEKDEEGGDNQGYVSCFVDATYRACFRLEDTEGCFYLYADGIYREAEIYVNGHYVGGSPYGYIPMTLKITDRVRKGDNLLEIYIDNRSRRCDRWYSGAGIYRRLSLIKTPLIHFPPHRLFIETLKAEPDSAQIRISGSVQNGTEDTVVFVEIFNKEGKKIRESSQELDRETSSFSLTVDLKNPCLWSPESPYLYKAQTSILSNGVFIDRCTNNFGIRRISFDSKSGLKLNGKPIKLYGVNLHHDGGCVGSAFFPELWRERLTDLKKLGLNAVRTSHNPQASMFYDLCDELGIMVINELYDKWYSGSYHAHFWNRYKEDVRAFVERDRNHPCVILWSVGNELSNQGLPDFYDPLDKLVTEVKKYDSGRPVSVALHPHAWPDEIKNKTSDEKAAVTAEIFKHTDLLMCNYQEQWYEKYHMLAPDACIIGSETYHWYTGNGESHEGKYEVHPFRYVKNLPYVLGGFYWAGYDYRGESLCRPARGWTSSLFDIAGFMRPQGMLAKAYWSDDPSLYVTAIDPNPSERYERPSWSFPPCADHTMLDYKDGDTVEFLIFTNCGTIDVYQGGRFQCTFKRRIDDEYWVRFHLKWDSAADITVIGKNEGKEVCRHSIGRHALPEKIRVTLSKSNLTMRADDVCVARIFLLDERGRLCVSTDRTVHIELEGLELLGIDNGDPANRRSYTDPTIRTFGGRCMLMVRGKKKGCGILSIEAEGVPFKETATIYVV
jgi:beta-galactosidase